MGLAAFSLVISAFFIVTQSSSELPKHDEQITIEVKVLVIHALQSKVADGGTLEDGRVWGIVIGGNVTMNFPEGIVILEAPSDQKDHEYVRLIKDKVSSHACSCGDFIQIETWKRFYVPLDPSTTRHKIYEIHERISGRGEYWLHFAIDTDQKEVILNFLGEAIFYDFLKFNKKGRIVREEFLHRTIPFIWGQALLVGFSPPKAKDGDRGSAYWFVVREWDGLHRNKDFK